MAEIVKAPMIYSAINKVMADIGAVGKNQKNTQQNFMFRGIDAVMNAINPADIARGVRSPNPLGNGEKNLLQLPNQSKLKPAMKGRIICFFGKRKRLKRLLKT